MSRRKEPSGALFAPLPNGSLGAMIWPPIECRCGRMAAAVVVQGLDAVCLDCADDWTKPVAVPPQTR